MTENWGIEREYMAVALRLNHLNSIYKTPNKGINRKWYILGNKLPNNFIKIWTKLQKKENKITYIKKLKLVINTSDSG